MALILAVGLVLGVFPMYGVPTVLCTAAALVLRVNIPAVQLINQIASPLQIILFFPLNRFGAHLLRGDVALPASWSLAGAARDAVIGWMCLCVPLGVVLYFVLAHALRRNAFRSGNLVGSAPAGS